MAAALEVGGLVSGYGPTRVIDDVTFGLPAGGRLAVLGRNGAGKSTFFKMLMGTDTPTSGQILYKGHDITRVPAFGRARLERLQIGALVQVLPRDDGADELRAERGHDQWSDAQWTEGTALAWP